MKLNNEVMRHSTKLFTNVSIIFLDAENLMGLYGLNYGFKHYKKYQTQENFRETTKTVNLNRWLTFGFFKW